MTAMIGLDTNVWVRYVTRDDPQQAKLALSLIARTERIFLSRTVLLELEWVLRAVYRLDREPIVAAMMQILGLRNVVVETPERVASALDHHRQGMGFADALHLGNAGHREFHTFDTRFAKQARELHLPVELIE